MDIYSLTRKKRPAHPTAAARNVTPEAAKAEQNVVLLAPPPQPPASRLSSPQVSTLPTPPSVLPSPMTESDLDGAAHQQKGSRPQSVRSIFMGNGDGGSGASGLIRSLSGTLMAIASPGSEEASTRTPPPTRAHWVPDADVDRCVGCNVVFTLIERRHHCRKCGDVFCNACSRHTARLDESAQFHEHGQLVRVCNKCLRAHNESNAIRQEVDRLRSHKLFLEKERERKEAELASERARRQAATPALDIRNPKDKEADAESSLGPLGSVPRDWNWSTF